MRWDAVPGALGYRLEVAHDIGFSDIILDQCFRGTLLQVAATPGTHYWRVSTIDQDDVESRPSKVYAIVFGD